MQKHIFVLIACWLGAGATNAQELYDFACCPNDDCQMSEIGQVTVAIDGWEIADLDEIILFDDPRIRTSRDGQFHICTRSTATPDLTQSQVSRLNGARTLKCLYVPAMS